MYKHNFGLTQDPFSIAPDPRFLFMSERHREALAHLLFGVAGKDNAAGGTGGGFVLLTGDIGTGKTTICRCFLEQIPAGCHVAYIFNPKLTVIELLQSICEEFHISVAPDIALPPTAKSYIDALNAFLLQSHAAGQSCVLIIDEAQNLRGSVLEQLRLLTNLETNERKLLQIVLIGQPELRTLLARPELEQLAQRVVARFHLDALNARETTHYIAHRLGVAGHTGALPFSPKALARIHQLAHGVPRRINLLCGRALLGAWANGQQRVDPAVVNKAALEVFGSGDTRASSWVTPHTMVALYGFVMLAATAGAGFLLWLGAHKTPPVSKAAAPTVPALAALPSASAASATSVASAPNAGASTAVPPTGPASAEQAPTALPEPVPHPVTDAATLLPTLAHDMNAAWRELALVWPLPAPDGDPCQAAASHQLQCHQAAQLTLPQLHQLGRPGILTLQSGKAAPVYAVLVGLSDRAATVQVGDTRHAIGLLLLSQLWQGDFATYWKPPDGYTASLRTGSTGPAIATMAHQLALAEGTTLPGASAPAAVLDADLRARVRAFQHAYGISPDGLPGPLTFMQMDAVLGLTKPRLQTEPQ